jgi:hypothetical protein
LDAPQEEADIFKPTRNHFEQDKHDQAPPHPIQDDTMDDEPIALELKGGFNISNSLQMRQQKMGNR